MPLMKDGFDYFYLNILVFLGNILVGCILGKTMVVVTSVVSLAIILYIRGLDYRQRYVYLLDQVAMLGILLPGLYAWIQSGPHKRLLAGGLFLTALGLYLAGLSMTAYSHSPNREDREFWHFVMHLFSSGGHLALLLEPVLLYFLLGNGFTK